MLTVLHRSLTLYILNKHNSTAMQLFHHFVHTRFQICVCSHFVTAAYKPLKAPRAPDSKDKYKEQLIFPPNPML